MCIIRKTEQVFNFYKIKRALKNVNGEMENDAEHTWSIHMLFLILQPELEKEFGQLDLPKVFQLITIHDIGELKTGDIPTWDKKLTDKDDELSFIIEYLNEIGRGDLVELMKHYEITPFADLSIEEKIVKSIDRISPSLLRLRSGEGWKNLKPPHNTIKNVRERQLVRHSFSKTMTALFEEILGEAIKEELI